MPPQTYLKSIVPKRHFKIDGGALTGQLTAEMETYLNYVRAQMQEDYSRVPERTKNDYSAHPPVRKYKRTNRLQRGWKVDHPVMINGTLTGAVYNSVAYAGYVQGPRRTVDSQSRAGLEQIQQARALRKRGWRSISDVARETRRNFTNVMNRTVISHK